MDDYFSLPDWATAEAFPVINESNKLAFCCFHDLDMQRPLYADGAVEMRILLSSCELVLRYEGVDGFEPEKNFSPEAQAIQFLDYSLRRIGKDRYEYTLSCTAGNLAFTFTGAHASVTKICTAAEYIAERVMLYRAHLRTFSPEYLQKNGIPAEEGERYPEASNFFFPFFDEKKSLGILSDKDMPYYAAYELYETLHSDVPQKDKKEKWRLEVGGWRKWFGESRSRYDLLPFFRKYAPSWAQAYAAAEKAYEKGDLAALSRLTMEHLTGNWHAEQGIAVLFFKDILNMSEFCATPQGQEQNERAGRLEREYVRAMLQCAQDELAAD